MSEQELNVSAAPPRGSPVPTSPASLIGYKLPPVCHEQKLKEVAMTAEELSELAFGPSLKVGMPSSLTSQALQGFSSTLTSTLRNSGRQHHHEAIAVSSSSSTCTRESDASDAEGNPTATVLSRPTVVASTPPSIPDQVAGLNREKSDQINAKVSQSKTSRQGRSSQRWVTASGHGPAAHSVGSDQEDYSAEHIRLVTGCVPILKDGKILLVSASRKAEWILPKGGWEMDEAMEESAIREVFEEAGVLGVLGPRLSELQYETRKSKKRKMEQAEMLEKKLKTSVDGSCAETDEPVLAAVECCGASVVSVPNAGAHGVPAPISNEDMTRIRSLSQECGVRSSDETASCTSGHSSAYSQVRMTLFPLYVNKVLASWPEEGRFRMAVDIDEAIEMQASRPEFKAALLEVKERGLHLVAS